MLIIAWGGEPENYVEMMVLFTLVLHSKFKYVDW